MEATSLPHAVYWNDAIAHLSQDAVLAGIISRYTGDRLASHGDAFHTLARSIVGQQISVKAAASVWAKLKAGIGRKMALPDAVWLLGDAPVCDVRAETLAAAPYADKVVITPEAVLAMSEDELRACGLSRMKASFLHALARHFVSHGITPGYWHAMSDQEVIADLVQIKGIGVWTAEMFLIFHLLRPDVFPVLDIGLQKGVAMAYGIDARDKKALLEFGERFRPYRSVATWFFWRSLDPIAVEY